MSGQTPQEREGGAGRNGRQSIGATNNERGHFRNSSGSARPTFTFRDSRVSFWNKTRSMQVFVQEWANSTDGSIAHGIAAAFLQFVHGRNSNQPTRSTGGININSSPTTTTDPRTTVTVTAQRRARHAVPRRCVILPRRIAREQQGEHGAARR
ncbi:hypothetical protein SPI_01440 [Niveomyces insectorum RCEF 264]|uniref:Uncharacterized protein n=1 Tax=Niveomyces insectorum RCEF 264 TaxID=1081102 RepID=A0A167YYX4_9HYPO|nr:hypothetical protein SPI_01440 [Niveomyces insectorum RCEF 264]